MQKCIYSIGHSNRSIEEFLELVKKYGIEVIIDVRRFPTSKIKEYKKENLKKICNERGIDYIHLENLGGFRSGYLAWMESNEWKNSFKILKEVAMNKKTAFLCAEKFPFHCHRRYISKKLYAEGWKVIHILNEKTWEEK